MHLSTDDFSYDLPNELIADQPVATRGDSRLLVLSKSNGQVVDKMYRDISDYVSTGDVVVLNDTKVIPARFIVHKPNGAERELILIEQHGATDNWFKHKVLYRRRLSVGDTLLAPDTTELRVSQLLGDGVAVIESPVDLRELAAQYGSVPLPPYMHRDATPADTERYQTVWAKYAGSVAAPTASLNMTQNILDAVRAKGASVVYLTLHVGLGTFLPIRVDDVTQHVMHKEYFEIPEDTANSIRKAKTNGHMVIAIGTTVTRTLEYAHQAILHNEANGLRGEADIFIYPGYEFKMVDQLITNFHAPRSTVLMLTAAFAGWDKLHAAYEHALAEKYHLLSYGDSMLITPEASI